jgi:hypothetical protein
MGPVNQGLWKNLGVCQVKNSEIGPTSFKHPVTGHNVWIFPDFPHLLKLLRNHLIDSGLTLPNGTKIDKTVIQDLLNAQKSEFRLTYKLSHKHLFARNQQRQKVSTAFQLFSNTVANAIRMLFPEKTAEADFFTRMNDFSDLMNVRTKFVNNSIYQSPFGTQYEEQTKFLNETFEYISNMTVGNRKKGTYAPFQKGLLIAIKSLQGIFSDLTDAPTHCQYLITTHLNQDFVENSFSVIRGIGHFNLNPNPVDLKYRIKKMIVGWNFGTGNNKCVASESCQEFVSSSKLRALAIGSPSSSVNDLSLSEEIELNMLEIDKDIYPAETTHSNLDEISSEGGKEYVAGFIARKFMESYPKWISNVNLSDSSGFWVHRLSNERLVEPSGLWRAYFLKFDEYFMCLHPIGGANRGVGIVKKLAEILLEHFPEVPEEVIKYYSRVRTLIRVKSLNKEIENEKFIKQEKCRQQKVEEFKNEIESQAQAMEKESQEIQDHAAEKQLAELLDHLNFE